MSETSDMVRDLVAEMSDTPENTPETAADGTETVDPTETPENGNKAAQEAKRYRLQLREAEAALEVANTRIQGYQTKELEAIAASHLSAPGDLLALSGMQLSDFLTEDGDVNAEAVKSTAETLLSSRPGLRKSARAVDPTQGFGSDQPLNGNSGPSWSDLLSR